MILKKEHLILTGTLKMIYSRKKLDYLKDNDSINDWEQGFMQGYLGDYEN